MIAEFDPLVVRAMARWPDVPAVFGWLRLDRRGNWLLIDRARPDFDETRHGAGSPITNQAILAFIGRNYACDDSGRWFWQNGPQRVYLWLDCAPWVIRVIGSGARARLITHTGVEFGALRRAALGPDGQILLESAIGCGVVHDLDATVLEFDDTDPSQPPVLQLAGQRWSLGPCADPAREFGFVARPVGPPQNQPDPAAQAPRMQTGSA